MVHAIKSPILDYESVAANVAQALANQAVERDRQGGLPEEEVNLLKKSGLLLQAAIALASTAAKKLDTGWQQGTNLTFEERGEIAIAVSAAKAFAIFIVSIEFELATDYAVIYRTNF